MMAALHIVGLEYDRKIRPEPARAEGANVCAVQRADDLVPLNPQRHAGNNFALLSVSQMY